jgi:hypothetical protein
LNALGKASRLGALPRKWLASIGVAPIAVISLPASKVRRRSMKRLPHVIQHVLHTFKKVTVEKIGVHPEEDGDANNSGC